MHVDLVEEAVGGVLLTAELLAGGVVAAEAGAVEALRWSGALPLLLRDLGARKIVALERLWAFVDDDDDQRASALLRTGTAGPPERLVLLLSGFLWDYEARLARLLALGVARRVVVCSSLSERAHECFDPAAVRRMDFRAFATSLAAHVPAAVIQAVGISGHKQQPQVVTTPTSTTRSKQAATAASPVGGEDEWGWNDDEDAAASEKSDDGDGHHHIGLQPPTLPPPPPTAAAPTVAPVVEVVQLPLHFAALLASKTRSPEPSVFVLCHPLCAAAFPLLLSHVIGPDGQLLSAPPTGAAAAPPVLPTYTHAKDVALEHIPSDFRRSLRLLAHTLGEMLVSMRLNFKERIFTMGATSLKIGHTLVRRSSVRQTASGGVALMRSPALTRLLLRAHGSNAL